MAQEHILIVLLHGIGDCLMALPAIRALKHQSPKTVITVMTLNKPHFHDLLQYNSDINHLLYSTLKRNPHYGNPLKFLGEYKIIQEDIERAKKKYPITKVHFITMFLMPAKLYAYLPFARYKQHKTEKVAQELGVVLASNKYKVVYILKDKTWATGYLKRNGLRVEKLIGLHFTGSTKNKSLSSFQGRRLINQLKLKGYDLLLFHDKHSYAREDEHFDSKQVITYVSDTILHTVALADYCQALICVDSGVAHIAVGLNKKVFVIYFKKIWQQNSLAIGDQVTSFLFKRKGKGLLRAVRLFLK